MTIVLRGYIRVPPEDLDQVARTLNARIRLTRQAERCLRFDVSQDDSDPLRFNVHDEFVDQAAFDVHQERMRGSSWQRASAHPSRHHETSREE